MKSILVTIVFTLMYCHGNSQNYIGDQKEIDQIIMNSQNFSKDMMNSDHVKLGDTYTKDAKIFPNRTKIITGKEAITKFWKLPDGVQTAYHKIIPEEIEIVDNTAYDYGYYEGKTKKSDGSEVEWKGKYVIVWKKVKTQWKIYLDIWNSVNP